MRLLRSVDVLRCALGRRISWLVTARLLPLSEGSAQAALDSWLFGQVAHGLAGLVVFAGGFWALTQATFTECKPRLLKVTGIWFRTAGDEPAVVVHERHQIHAAVLPFEDEGEEVNLPDG